MEVILYIIVVLLLVNLLALWLTRRGDKTQELQEQLSKLLYKELGRLEQSSRQEIALNREEVRKSLQANREEQANSFHHLGRSLERQLQGIREENSKKLEEMRIVVDEKLQSTLEKRFNDSFKLISERLEQVHKGLGEMQTLASGVGDLKRVLTNVKTRGTLGEIQLGSILEQILSPEQYETNVAVRKNSMERVEFAVKLPSKLKDNTFVLLPIDSKFPVEDYQRLLDLADRPGQVAQAETELVSRQFETAVKKNARDIRDKYLNPPATTDFAIMFVPTEGLYAEIIRRPALFESLQREYKITVVGPSNLVAFLNSLQMGFRTLAIEKRSSEVWEILGAVKTEFGHFGNVLDKTRKKLQEASNVIDQAGVRTRAIERKLRDIEELPPEDTARILGDAFQADEE